MFNSFYTREKYQTQTNETPIFQISVTQGLGSAEEVLWDILVVAPLVLQLLCDFWLPCWSRIWISVILSTEVKSIQARDLFDIILIILLFSFLTLNHRRNNHRGYFCLGAFVLKTKYLFSHKIQATYKDSPNDPIQCVFLWEQCSSANDFCGKRETGPSLE